jgi:hypothetical protein
MRLTAQRDRGRLAWQIRRVQKRMAEIEARLTRAAHSETVSRSQPQEQVTSQRGFPVLVNGSWPAAATAATSHKPTSRPVALPRPLRVSLLPCLADGFLLGRGDRAALERTDQEDSAQKGWKHLPHYSIT